MTDAKSTQARETKRKMEQVARQLFVERGYDNVSGEEIVARSAVTRGALYHHYDGKKGLFEAVVDTLMQEVHGRLAKGAAGASDPLQAVERGIGIFLKVCTEPGTQRILLVDAPAVLGWSRWREMDAKYGFGLLRQGLAAAMAAGRMRPQDPDVLAHILLGAMTETALAVARSDRPDKARKEAERALLAMLDGWRIQPK